MSLTTSAHWMYNAGGGFYDTLIDGSLRFESGDSAYLSRNMSAGNRRTFTISCWVKRSLLGDRIIMGRRIGGDDQWQLHFQGDDELDFYNQVGGALNVRMTTSSKFRDTSAWYHIVLKVDTTVGTSANAIYVNGVEQPLHTDTSSNSDTYVNTSGTHYIGQWQPGGSWNGYMSDFYFIDGQALDASNFGETKSGVWIPKEYSGSYGTNGFHLEFAGNTNDTSGNGNNWTANNISSYDYVPDSPTNNFATNRKGLNQSASQGNLRFERTLNANNHTGNFPNMFAKTGKWYCELRMIDSGIDTAAFAVVEGGSYNEPADTTAYQYTVDAQTVIDGKGYYSWIINANKTDGFVQSETSYGTALTANVSAIIMCALDLENGKVWWGKDGTWFNSGDPAAGTNAAFTSSNLTDSDDGWGFASSIYTGRSNAIHIFNYGQDSTFAGNETAGGNADDNGYGDFKYAPPSGFLAMCSANLPDPAIDPAQGESPADYFNTVLYTGDGTSSKSVTGVGHAPDLLWFKKRSGAESHHLGDTIRGASKRLVSNTTAAETTESGLVSFDSDGFTISGASGGSTNDSGATYAAWSWKAGGTAVTNSDGSQSCSVSANPDAGFSIVKWTPSASTGTLGHGLSTAPDMVITKPLASSNWFVQSRYGMTASQVMNLDATSGAYTPGYAHFNSTFPTASVFSYGGYLGNSVVSGDKIAYCFHSVDGFSKIGAYVGNGSADGTFIYTGFRPAWIIIKRTDSTSSWHIIDDKRLGYNDRNDVLLSNSSSAEQTNYSVQERDILSNGFKMRDSNAGTNASGGTYIYLAFAENPFKYANAR